MIDLEHPEHWNCRSVPEPKRPQMIDAATAEFCIAYIRVVRAQLTGEMMARLHPDRRIDSIDGFFRCYGGYNRKVFSEN